MLACFISISCVFVDGIVTLGILAVLISILFELNDNVVIVYVLEMYSTRIRGAASSYTFIAGRLFTALMPYLLSISEDLFKDGSFALVAILSFIQTVLIIVVKSETNQRELDTLLN